MDTSAIGHTTGGIKWMADFSAVPPELSGFPEGLGAKPAGNS
jgi:hypothetical protein